MKSYLFSSESPTIKHRTQTKYPDTMPRSTAPILTLLPLDDKPGSIEIDPENIVMGKVTAKDANIFFNFKYRHEGKMYPLKVHFPILPTRMYEKYNPDYDSVTRKTTIRLIRDQMDEEDFDMAIDKINAIQDRMDQVFSRAMEEQFDSNMKLKKAKSIIDVDHELKKLEDMLFFYEEDKEGNPIEDPDHRQFLSIKIEPNRDWLVPKVKLLGYEKDKIIPVEMSYTDCRTGLKTSYSDLTPDQLEWFHLLDLRTESSCVVNFDSYLVRIKGPKDLVFHRRVYLAVNSIADFIESDNDDGAAEAAEELFGDSVKVNTNLDQKFAAYSKFIPSGEKEDTSTAVVFSTDEQNERNEGNEENASFSDDNSGLESSNQNSAANSDNEGEDSQIKMPPTRRRKKKSKR